MTYRGWQKMDSGRWLRVGPEHSDRSSAIAWAAEHRRKRICGGRLRVLGCFSIGRTFPW
jgi:hypothetical protein